MSRLPRSLWRLIVLSVLTLSLAIYLLRTNPVPEPHGCDGLTPAGQVECARPQSPTPTVPGVQP